MMEQLVGMAVLGAVFTAALICYWIYTTIANWLSNLKAKRKSLVWRPRMICRCPGCRADIFHRVKAAMEKDSAYSSILVRCTECDTRSIWLPIANPPELSRYMLPHSHRWVTSAKDRSKRASPSLRSHG